MEINATLTAGLVAAIVALAEVIKWLLQKRKNTNGSLSKEERGWLQDLWKQHQKFDTNGTPLWYVPRSWMDRQDDILKLTNKSIRIQERIDDTLKRIERRLQK
jgi:hypothetical protein